MIYAQIILSYVNRKKKIMLFCFKVAYKKESY